MRYGLDMPMIDHQMIDQDGKAALAPSSNHELYKVLQCPTAHRIRPRSSLAPGAFLRPAQTT
jgi:hypothetical protein